MAVQIKMPYKILLSIAFLGQLVFSTTTMTLEESFTTIEFVLPTVMSAYMGEQTSSLALSDDAYGKSVVSFAAGIANYEITNTALAWSYDAGMQTTDESFIDAAGFALYEITSMLGSGNDDSDDSDNSSNDSDGSNSEDDDAGSDNSGNNGASDGSSNASSNTTSTYLNSASSIATSNSLSAVHNNISENAHSVSSGNSEQHFSTTLNTKKSISSLSSTKNETSKTSSNSTAHAGSHGMVGSNLGMIVSLACAILLTV